MAGNKEGEYVRGNKLGRLNREKGKIYGWE